MKKTVMLIVCLAATFNFSFEAFGETAPIVFKTAPVEREIVRGEKVAVDLHILTLSGVIVDFNQLRSVKPKNFIFEDMISSGLAPYDQRYNYQRVRMLFSLDSAVSYGFLELPKISLAYRIADEDGKTKSVGGVKSIEKLRLEVVAFRIKADPDKQVIRVGEKVHYKVIVVHEKPVKVLVEKDKVAAGPWKFLGYTLDAVEDRKVIRTAIDFVYTYYNLPERVVELPGPLFFVKVPQADKAAEVKMNPSRFLVRSSLSPDTRFQSWDKTRGFRSPLRIYGSYISYGVYGLAILIFISGAALSISSFGRVGRLRRVAIAKPERVYRVKKQLEIHLVEEMPSDTQALRKYGVDLYCLLQRFLGAECSLLSEEALATPLVKFRDSAPKQDRSFYEPLLQLEKVLWGGECLNVEEIQRINDGIGCFMRQTRSSASHPVATFLPVDF